MPPMAMTTTMATDSVTRRFAAACGVLRVEADAPAPAAALQEPGSPAGRAQQLTIFYGGRVVVLDGCKPATAAELIRYAAAAAGCTQVAPVPEPVPVDIPIARKASLQRFLAKRKYRTFATARAPYGWPEETPAAKKRSSEATSREPSSWLALGSLVGKHAP